MPVKNELVYNPVMRLEIQSVGQILCMPLVADSREEKSPKRRGLRFGENYRRIGNCCIGERMGHSM